MVPADTRGEGRSRPDWGSPAPKPRSKAAPKAGAKPAPTRKAAPKATGRKAPAGKRSAPPKGKGRPAAKPKGRPAPRAKRRGGAKWSRQFRQRYAVVYDVDGPRVRLGVCWFLLAVVAIAAGPLTTAVLYGGAAALAAAQVARLWRRLAPKPVDVMAAGGAALAAGGACFGAGGAGLGILGAVGLGFVGAAGDQGSGNPRVADVGWTLQCALAPGAVALSMVLLTRLDQGSAIALLLLVSAYETGDYLIGSGASNPYEGPCAGIAAIVVITFIVSTLPVSALSFGEAWLLGGAVAVLAPAGQLLASALLPSAGAPALALRRLDSLLLAAPLWAWAVGVFAS